MLTPMDTVTESHCLVIDGPKCLECQLAALLARGLGRRIASAAGTRFARGDGRSTRAIFAAGNNLMHCLRHTAIMSPQNASS